MPIRNISLVFLALALGGCVLESKSPLIGAEAGEPLLDGYGTQFAIYGLNDGEWKKDNETLSFTAKGRHYSIASGGDTMDVAFSKLDGNWWVVQAQEPGKQATYALIDAEKGELFLYPIACKPLKDAGTYEAWVSFTGDDCVIKDGADTTAMFRAFAADPGPQTSKIVPKG